MLTAGKYHTLKINRVSTPGLYLADEEGNEVLLPNRFVSMENKVGDEMRVFVYHDSEDRIVASTETPYATVGQAAYLKVVDQNAHGAFLDWGIKAKDLFIPNRNQPFNMEVGKKYVVYVYTDNVTGRAVATAKQNSFVRNDEIAVKEGYGVDIMIATESAIGYRVVVNDRNWGMLYRNQVFKPVHIGDRMKAYVARVTDDRRIDVSLQQAGYDEVKKSAERLVELARANGGALPLSDGSSPADIYRLTEMSKKVFKRSAGYLMKHGLAVMPEKELVLTGKE